MRLGTPLNTGHTVGPSGVLSREVPLYMQSMALGNIDNCLPFLISGPGISEAVNVTEVVQNVDLLPTWLGLVQARGPIDPKQRNGKSIVPLLREACYHLTIKVNQIRSVALGEM